MRKLPAILALLFAAAALCLSPSAFAAKAGKAPKSGGLADSLGAADLPPSTLPPRAELEAGLKSHDRAILIANFFIRDPFIGRGPDADDYYYLTGTVPTYTDTTDSVVSGHGKKATDTAPGVRLWRSKNLLDWEYLGKIYSPDLSQSKNKNVWAPELHWLGNRWGLIHCPGENSRFALAPIGEKDPAKGPWTEPMNFATLQSKHDGSLFWDADTGTAWMIWNPKMQIYAVAPLNKTLTAWAAKPTELVPAGKRTGKLSGETTSRMGHEGAGVLKIGNKYLWFGTAWSTDVGRRGSYNLYYATADKITGPYGPRRFVGRFLGHGYPFQAPDGQWWCTAFTNANVPPLPRKGIETRDLSDNAYTINQCGLTIVPLEVRALPDGDIQMRALDPAYATPGPDEAQKFKN